MKNTNWLGIIAVTALVIWLWQPDWAVRYWYASVTVPFERVYLHKKPIDCNWTTAPLGAKGCHYERNPVTWSYAESLVTPPGGVSPTAPYQVNIFWSKKDDTQ